MSSKTENLIKSCDIFVSMEFGGNVVLLDGIVTKVWRQSLVKDLASLFE